MKNFVKIVSSFFSQQSKTGWKENFSKQHGTANMAITLAGFKREKPYRDDARVWDTTVEHRLSRGEIALKKRQVNI